MYNQSNFIRYFTFFKSMVIQKTIGKNSFLKKLIKYDLDITLYSSPYFILSNLLPLLRLLKFKALGKKVSVIYYVNESDGRFFIPYLLSLKPHTPQTVWFKFDKEITAQEANYFESYAKRPIGFYEDARQRYNEKSNLENRLNYKKWCHRLLDSLSAITGKPALILSGSNNDRYVVELITAAQEKNISWVCSEREGTGTPYSYEFEGLCFKESESIQAHYIFTANDNHKKMFEVAKLPSVKSIETVGELDTDFFFHWNRNFQRKKYKKWKKFKKKLMFFTFGLRNYIEPYLFPEHPDLSWIKLLTDAEETLFQFAKNNPDILVIYKMGHKEDQNQAFIDSCVQAGLENVEILDRSFPAEELLLYVDMIVGFQTTALFEAMFTDVPIVFLNWNIPSEVNPKTHMLPIANSNACLVAKSKKELSGYLNDFVTKAEFSIVTENMKKARKATRELMFFQADGKTGERFFNRLLEIVRSKNEIA